MCDAQTAFCEVVIVIPTRNAKSDWEALAQGIQSQGFPADQVIVVDSSSEDGTGELAGAKGFKVVTIRTDEFNHGATRQYGITLAPWATIVVFLTQDTVLAAPDSIIKLISPFADCAIAATFGRQLPKQGAGPIEAHARIFNYPTTSVVRTYERRHELGFKATFFSNSFSAYRVSALNAVGGFPSDIIMGEDTIVAARLLMSGWKTAYIAEATAFHSHSHTMTEEFRRYFDTGVYHRREGWLRDKFGGAGGEGKRFVMSELTYLRRNSPFLIPTAIVRTVVKLLGYKLGLQEHRLGTRLSRRLSLHRQFWENQP